MSVAETDGETPLAVFISPWTIQGWRPFSVSIHPAVLMRKGRITTQGAIRRNHLACPAACGRGATRPTARRGGPDEAR